MDTSSTRTVCLCNIWIPRVLVLYVYVTYGYLQYSYVYVTYVYLQYSYVYVTYVYLHRPQSFLSPPPRYLCNISSMDTSITSIYSMSNIWIPPVLVYTICLIYGYLHHSSIYTIQYYTVFRIYGCLQYSSLLHICLIYGWIPLVLVYSSMSNIWIPPVF